ncbi:hypothetical protein [Hymenobacter rigui]|uniref:Uncharacterized protein n=1 Tax=Hymenobacter rigui TaxID=334424 RepID=A0A3R9P0W0_9BACT|nr:hypothetical protein [Hymenobacter rigui]RSK47758.1 hypothetical protein EI291_14260 [Hymenobacter rigui]
MKQLILLLCLCIVSLLHTSCKKEDSGEIRIRVKNASSYRFESVYVNTSGGENEYGPLAAKQVSDYAVYKGAYNYAYIKVVINGREMSLQPTDYVGETPLDPGKYTYVVDVEDLSNGRLKLTFETP